MTFKAIYIMCMPKENEQLENLNLIKTVTAIFADSFDQKSYLSVSPLRFASKEVFCKA